VSELGQVAQEGGETHPAARVFTAVKTGLVFQSSVPESELDWTETENN